MSSLRRACAVAAISSATAALALSGPSGALFAPSITDARVLREQPITSAAIRGWQPVSPKEAAADARQIVRLRAETRRWLRLIGRPVVARSLQGRTTVSFWRARAAVVRSAALHPPHLRQWLCIHRYEGDWAAHTGNGYYGGLQMDIGFQRAYGAWLLAGKGTADRWTPLEQMLVAERAHASGLGFSPWPNTARICGLL
jgi:hypothetical protein